MYFRMIWAPRLRAKEQMWSKWVLNTRMRRPVSFKVTSTTVQMRGNTEK